jgi:hypothetical protein
MGQTLTVATETLEFLASHIADAGTQWSLGTFGAIAEFMRDAGEPATFSRDQSGLAVVTARGGMRIEPAAGMRPFAFETTTKESWSSRVALCLPAERCAMNRRAVLTEVGPDTDALREQDKTAILFDLGIGATQADFHVRISDPGAAAQLRMHTGKPALESGSPAMQVIFAANPHRVFVSRLGRVEVFQPIPPAHGKSPDGPHTHVLPNLLRHKRTHSATEPIPGGWIPCAHLYPAHPSKDPAGNVQPFNQERHEAFEDILRVFGDPKFLALKERVVAAVVSGDEPSAVKVTNGRFLRTHVRVALRQLKATHGDLPMLAAWMAAHDRSTGDETEDHRARHHR